MNTWVAQLEEHVEAFGTFATNVAAWDQVVVRNGDKIRELHDRVVDAGATQSELDADLDQLVAGQKDMKRYLDSLEGEVDALFAKEEGRMGPADVERAKAYQIAGDVKSQLNQMEATLTDLVQRINKRNDSAMGGVMGQITEVLNAHFNSLQYIDATASALKRSIEDVSRGVESKALDLERMRR